jgi:hypothetical protein
MAIATSRRETMKLNQDIRCPGRDSNQELPQYVSKLLPLDPLVPYNPKNKPDSMHMHLYSLTQ